ncbi:hypothetical protein FPQ18DRAFT_90186 [Pyronema domesticum]|nr:hypothetical protein FPQ18DRAFT_90186 [Pyronema domesticum]
MAHSKRNTSLAFFTSYERSLLKSDYGLQRTRLSRDSFKSFDSCNLCLERCRDPVSCPNGDLFCRECAVENLLAQRKEIKRMQMELDKRIAEEEEFRKEEQAREDQERVKRFEEVLNGLEGGRKKTAVNTDDVEEGLTAQGKRKFELDEEEIARMEGEERKKARAALEEEKKKDPTKNLPSFWVPSLTPSIKDTDIIRKPPKLNPVCPASGKDHIHYYSLKGLVSVKFTELEEEKTKHGDPQRICPSCKKVLSNAVKAMLAKPCGHVVCKPCADKFMTATNDDPHDQTEKLVQCYVCDAVLTDQSSGEKGAKGSRKGKKEKGKGEVKPGLVQIQSDGTGFSAGGGNVTTEKQGIAFQC